MRSLLVLGLLASLAFAGCLEEDATPDSDPVTDDFDLPVEVSFETSFSWELVAAVGTPVVVLKPGAFLGATSTGAIEVPANATSFTATADGSCTSGPVCSLALVAFHGGEQKAVVEGTLPLELTVDDPAFGKWTLAMFADMNGAVALGAVGEVTVNGTALQ